MKNELNIYRELQIHLDQFPIGFPPTNSGVEIRLLKYLFTPEEAKIACLLKFSWNELDSLENIYERSKFLGYTMEQLENYLDNMAKKGAIKILKNGDKKTYGNAMLIVGIFENQVNKLTKQFIEDMHQYMREAWIKDLMKVPIPQWRTIPIGLDFEHEINIGNYDDIKKLIKIQEGPIAIINCVCRQARDILEKPCKATSRREVCMGFGQTAQIYIDLGWARQISKKEAYEFLHKSQEESLIFQVGNAQIPEIICSCCTCCCEGLYNLKKLPNPGEFIRTNHFAKIIPNSCTCCGACIDKCQMGAIYFQENTYLINQKRCIGCGNCVIACASDAIKLCKKEKQYVPPMTHNDLYNEILALKKKRKNRELKRKLRIKKRMLNRS